MVKEEIKQIMPHREPMLLIDEMELIDADHCLGRVKIRGDEWFLQGHFPGNPVVPGVILCEMMAQSSAILMKEQLTGCIPYFTGINHAKFKDKVLPGDTVEFKCTLIKSRKNFYFVEAKGYVEGKLCSMAEISFALVKGV